MDFYVGLHQVSDCQHFDNSFVSVNRLWTRKSNFAVNNWMMDCGAFTEISTHGHYRNSVGVYANEIKRWKACGNLKAVVSQDYMCEAFILAKTGKTVLEHQAMTIERYDALLAENLGVYLLPVLQGWCSTDYVDHIRAYGSRLAYGAWVGVGSICKRNSNPISVFRVLDSIMWERPDLKLHGFGLKSTALKMPGIVERLHTADSMAWSFAARRETGSGNNWRDAKAFEADINGW